MTTPVSRSYDKRVYKKCIKCRNWKPRKDIMSNVDPEVVLEKHGFGAHNSSDGLQSICFSCKNVMNKGAREKNVTQRIRHHTATRCMTQLGDLAPEGFVKDLEKHLGYNIKALVRALSAGLKTREGSHRKLRDALNEGYHIDHVRPLSSFPVIVTEPDPIDGTISTEYVDWAVFRTCWDISNLSAIPAEENLAKGAKRTDLLVDDLSDVELTSKDKDNLMKWFDKENDNVSAQAKEVETDAEATEEVGDTNPDTRTPND